MSTHLDRFNWLARHYDFLSGIIFGKTLHQSQVCFLSSIPADCAILIIGGGTGEMLKELLMVNPTCRVWYVEASGQMVSLAREKISKDDHNRVWFIHGTEVSLPDGIFFDVVITNFFLDLFTDARVLHICKTLWQKLNNDGLWLISDFVDEGKWWHRFLLWSMYRFFALTCDIEGSRLPPWEKQLAATGLTEMKFEFFYGMFIKSSVYKKIHNG